MSKLTIACLAVAALLLPGSAGPSSAQSIGYAQALDRLGRAAARISRSSAKRPIWAAAG